MNKLTEQLEALLQKTPQDKMPTPTGLLQQYQELVAKGWLSPKGYSLRTIEIAHQQLPHIQNKLAHKHTAKNQADGTR